MRKSAAVKVEPEPAARLDVSLESVRAMSSEVDRARWVRLVASLGYQLASANDSDSWWHDVGDTWIRVKARRGLGNG